MQSIEGSWTKVNGQDWIDDITPAYDVTTAVRNAMVTPDSGSTWYTVIQSLEVIGIPKLIVVESAGSFTAQSLDMYFQDFTDNFRVWYGPRYCFLGTALIICSKYATMYSPPSGPLRLLTGIYRARDVINFAGRPVLIGTVTASNQYDQSPTPSLSSDLLRWPTRGDFTDWDSYGSGFLYTKDDQGSHRAGCVWGESAFLFTTTAIYRMIETGLSASNPIALEKFPVRNYDPPISNVVQGRKGLYYWSVRGPVLFDGHDVIPLYDMLEKDPYLYNWTNFLQGVFVWADVYSQSIRFYNKSQYSNLLRYMFWEKTGAFTTLNSSPFYLAGIGIVDEVEYWGIDAMDIPNDVTPVSRQLDEFAGTVSEGGSSYVSGKIIIRGITFEEGAFVNKIPKAVRIVGKFPTSTSGNNAFQIGLTPDSDSPGIGWEVAVTGSAKLQQFSFQVDPPIEASVWSLRIDLPLRGEIHEIYIDYVLGGDLEHDEDIT
jgi:hypothetical protein